MKDDNAHEGEESHSYESFMKKHLSHYGYYNGCKLELVGTDKLPIPGAGNLGFRDPRSRIFCTVLNSKCGSNPKCGRFFS